jgi:4-hydroxy-tetrahydrodipicolinate synthase
MNHLLSGVYAAAVTPLGPDLSPDLDAIPALLDFFARRGCHGALLLGTTGEGPSFAPDERQGIYRAALAIRATHPDFKLLAGTGTPSLSETISLTRLAFDLGYDGVVTLPPYYYRKATDEGLFAWFSQVIQQAVPRDGFLLGYHFPGVAGIGFSHDLLEQLKDRFPIQFAGIKDSSHDEGLVRSLGEQFGDELAVFTGTDSYLELAMENFAAGCITAPANLISPGLREVWDAMAGGHKAEETMQHVSEQRHILEKYSPFPPVLKALLSRLHGFPRWPVKPPLVDVTPDVVEQALQEFSQID